MFALCNSIVIRNYTTTSAIVGAILYLFLTVIQFCTPTQQTVSDDGLLDTIVTIVSSTRVLVSCVVGVWLGCVNVVPTTVRESAPSDSKENKQADAGSRLFSKVFLYGALL